MLDNQIIAEMAGLYMEIEGNLAGESSPASLNINIIQKQLNNLISQYPAEANEFLKEFRILPYFGVGDKSMNEIKPYRLPSFMLNGVQLDDTEMTDQLYPDGPVVFLDYEYGKLTAVHVRIGDTTYDFTHKEHLLTPYVHDVPSDWSELPLKTLEGILAITKSDAKLLSEINFKPLYERAASFEAIKTLFDNIFTKTLHVLVIDKEGFSFPINPSDFYLTKQLGKRFEVFTLITIPAKKVTAVIKNAKWVTTLAGYTALELSLYVDGQTVTITTTEFYQMVLSGFCIGSSINLAMINGDYFLDNTPGLSNERKLYPPKVSEETKARMFYEGSNGMSLFIRDPSVSNTLKVAILKILKRNTFDFKDHPSFLNYIREEKLTDLFLFHVDFHARYGIEDTLYGLGINGLDRLEAHLISKVVKSPTDIFNIFDDPAALVSCGVDWTKAIDICNFFKIHGGDYYDIISNFIIDYDVVKDPPKVVGILGTFKITRFEMAEYFNYYDIDLVEEGLRTTPVVILGAGANDYVVSQLESAGVMIIRADHYLDINLLINDVMKFLGE